MNKSSFASSAINQKKELERLVPRQIEENFISSTDIVNMRTRTMTLREDSVNKESSHMDQGAAMDGMDLPVTVAGNGRTISLGTIDTAGTAGIADSNQMDTIGGDGDDETSARLSEAASAMKFQPLQPIAEKALFPTPHQSNSANNSTQDQITQPSVAVPRKESGSFMNNIQDPVAASKVFKRGETDSDDQNVLSHTPPTSVSTSYETMHFGKRPRSGVSSFVG